MEITYEQYAAYLAAAQKKEKSSGVKVGFFRLAEGQEALVRFMFSKLEDLSFASIHRVKKNAEDRYNSIAVSCLNPLGKTGECPLCAAAEAGDERVNKVGKRVFVKMIVRYKDEKTGAWTEPEPVVWERPAGFYKELMSKLNSYGDLTKQLLKITRSGSGLDTKYSIDYAVPAVFKPEMIPEDFSIFNDLVLSRHSYWIKTAEECEVYLKTGAFPEVTKTEQAIEPKKTVADVAKTITTEQVSSPVEDESPFETPTSTSVESTGPVQCGNFKF